MNLMDGTVPQTRRKEPKPNLTYETDAPQERPSKAVGTGSPYNQRYPVGPNQKRVLAIVKAHPGITIKEMLPKLKGKVPDSYLITSIYTGMKQLVRREMVLVDDQKGYHLP